jgi:hypothetical protein
VSHGWFAENKWKVCAMNDQLEVAKHRLFDPAGLRATNVKLFPGSNREATKAQMAEQVTKAIAQIEAGDFEEVDPQEVD